MTTAASTGKLVLLGADWRFTHIGDSIPWSPCAPLLVASRNQRHVPLVLDAAGRKCLRVARVFPLLSSLVP